MWLALGLLSALVLVLVLAVVVGRLGQGAPSEEAGSPAVTHGPDLRTDPPGSPDLLSRANSGDAHDDAGSRMIDGLPVVYIRADPPFDLFDPDLVVANADYVLVGRIERHAGTRHPDSPSLPQTDYDVTVLEVVKGSLKAGQEVVITKQGGIVEGEGGSCMELYNKYDFMPEAEGGVYVFAVEVLGDPGRTLSVIGAHSTVPLEDGVAAELRGIEKPIDPGKKKAVNRILEKSEVFARYVAAANNKNAAAGLPQWMRDRERYKSAYER